MTHTKVMLQSFKKCPYKYHRGNIPYYVPLQKCNCDQIEISKKCGIMPYFGYLLCGIMNYFGYL